MGKVKNYLILDTETATLSFINEMNLTPDQKKKVAIARPLVYDIGWTIANRTSGVLEKKQFLVAETFSVPTIFNTAYYKEKRPLYLEMLKNGETTIKPWNEIATILIEDMAKCERVCAFNGMFDFCKAIPFTDLYISKLYSDNYYEWEQLQRRLCDKIAHEPYKSNERDFDPMNFHFRNAQYPMIDIWGLACANIINKPTYKRACLENGLLSPSGMYFSTNAENVKRFICKEYGFIESHTALSDAEIETEILFHGLKCGKKTEGIIYFPFRALGDVSDFVVSDGKITCEMAENALRILEAYLNQQADKHSAYKSHVEASAAKVANFIMEKWGD